jgi:hypothetical protein
MRVQTPRVRELPRGYKHQHKTLCLDFDGVLHRYSQGWQGGEIYDPPTEGTEDALGRLSTRYDFVVCTARHNLDDVEAWLRAHRLRRFMKAPASNRKPAAFRYVDDRGLLFTGSWEPVLDELL